MNIFRLLSVVHRIWFVLVLVLLASGSRAGTPPLAAASPITPEKPQSHAWVVLTDHPSRPGSGQAVLIHVPPRDGPLPSAIGSAVLARTLEAKPQALAAWGDTVYLAFAGQDSDDQPLIRVRSLHTFAQGFGWGYHPTDRFTPHPALQVGGSVRGMAAFEGTIALLIQQEGEIRMFALVRNQWREVAEDQEMGGEAATPVALWSSPRGIQIGLARNGELIVRQLVPDSNEFHFGPVRKAGKLSPGELFPVGESVFILDRDDHTLQVELLTADRTIKVLSFPLRVQAQVAPIVAPSPRILALWWERPISEDPRPSLPTLSSIEASLGTGEILHRGPIPHDDVVSIDEFRMLAMMLTAVIIGVLVIVLKGDLDQDSVPLPDGTALASPLVRLLATGVDLAIAIGLTAWLFGVGFLQIATLEVLLRPRGAWITLPSVLVIGATIGTLSEAWLGRTVGKWLFGLQVIRVCAGTQDRIRPGLSKSFIRNTIKWIFPPIAALATVDENFRHRGDQIAGLVVIVRTPEQGPKTES